MLNPQKKMVTDKDTDLVFLSSWLEKEKKYRDFHNRLTALLLSSGIEFRVLDGTEDIWMRDYMPVQIKDDIFVQYVYNPDYLQRKRRYITDADPLCNRLGIPRRRTDLVIDGGNVVKTGRHVIMTEKVYSENVGLTPDEIMARLRDLFQCEIIMLPWDRRDRYGHADGIVRPIDENTVLLTHVDDFGPEMTEAFEAVLCRHFSVRRLHYEVDRASNGNWAYINFLRVGDTIILPALGVPEDRQAFDQFTDYYPDCRILQIDASEIIRDGGALNCVTWTVKSRSHLC